MTPDIKVYDVELRQAFSLYLSELEEFLYRPLTPAMKMRMEDKLKSFGMMMYQREHNPIWKIPVKLNETGLGSFELTPDLTGVTVYSRNSSNARY